MEKEELIIGKKYLIHAYKHDGKIHRSWDEAVLLEIHDEYLVFGNEKTKVTESDGRTWHTKEPAVLCFYYNILFIKLQAVYKTFFAFSSSLINQGLIV